MNRNVKRNIDHYNLDMIIALGYRVQSDVAVRFRIWETKRLHEYIQKVFAIDDERLKQGGVLFEVKETVKEKFILVQRVKCI